MAHFNLITEPWIGARTLSGDRVSLGLQDLVARAHELQALANESPLTSAALARLLLALVHRVVGPKSDLEWERLYKVGRFDELAFSVYLEKWRSRFDLFDDQYPFYQIGHLIEQSPNYERGKKPAREMIAEQSSYGGARELFESRPSDASYAIPPQVAARWLVALHAFHPGGLLTRDTNNNGDPTSAKAGPVCSSAVALIQGSNLFETLVFNLINYPSQSFPSQADDAPVWEIEPSPKASSRACRGLLDWYTWQSRRIQLLPDADGAVDSFILLQGVAVTEAPRIDPMCAYRRHQKHGLLPIGFSTDRALWRDVEALCQISSTEDREFQAPTTVRVLAARDTTQPWEFLNIELNGQEPDQAKILLSRSESVAIPRELFTDEALLRVLQTSIKKCEGGAQALNAGLFVALKTFLGAAGREPPTKDVRNLIASTQAIPRYWAQLKAAFDQFLFSLGRSREEAARRFQFEIRRAVLREYETAALSIGHSARALRGLSAGRRTLFISLAEAELSAADVHAPQESVS
jgi:CRISPR system Cascade subunit CasA